jgi:aldehyde dehydrogenase (NAD+)
MPLTEPDVRLLPEHGLLIGGARITDTGSTWEHVYPGTGKPTATVALATPADVDGAVAAARGALARWRALSANTRRDMLLALGRLVAGEADRLAGLQTLENGTPLQFTAAAAKAAADQLTYYGGWADKVGGDVVPTWPSGGLDYTLDEPYGVIAAIVPWNGPLVSTAQLVGAALAAGNTIVVKPSELAPFTALRLGELALAAGLPPGVVNVVPGGADAGQALVGHPDVDKVHFTGSTDTARRVLATAATQLTPVCLELGGKSAQVIFADADVKAAARHALSGLVVNSGQGCVNGTRLLVESSVYDEVLRLVTARLAPVRVGDPFATGVSMGPVITESACDRIVATIGRARADGHGRLLTGGHRLDGELADGYFVEPTVFADVPAQSPLAQEEIFGPVLCVQRFDTEAEAVRLANGTRYGLAAYLHTRDVRRAHRVASALDAGSVWINGFYGLSPSAPFGGTKHSGYGRTGGRAGIAEFTRPKNVWLAV